MLKKLQISLSIILWTNIVVFAQNVDGIVTDGNGEPIIGATIVVKGSGIFAVTGIDGRVTDNIMVYVSFFTQNMFLLIAMAHAASVHERARGSVQAVMEPGAPA